MCSSCNCNSSSAASSTPKADKVKAFIRPASEYTSRTVGAIARGIGGTAEDVLAALKEDPSRFAVRLGVRGDLYISLAD